MARQHGAVGRDDHEAPPPAVHARARAIRVPVGQDEDDLHPPLEARCALRRRRRARARGRPRSAGARRDSRAPTTRAARSRARADRPPDARRARRSPSTRSMFSRWRTTLSVSGKPELLHPRRDAQLLVERREAGDAVALVGLRVLNAELHVVEARREAREARALERDAARDEADVEIARASARRDGLEVARARVARRRSGGSASPRAPRRRRRRGATRRSSAPRGPRTSSAGSSSTGRPAGSGG